MKTRQSHTTAAQGQKKTTPFFNKGGRQKAAQRKAEPFFNNIQTKLTIGASNDIYEKEADQVADSVVQRMSDPSAAAGDTPWVTPLRRRGSVQQKCAHCAEKEKKEAKGVSTPDTTIHRKPIFESEAQQEETIQRKCACENEEVQKKGDGSQDAPADLESRLSSSAGSGSPLPSNTRTQMESSIGADFSKVRIHNSSSDAQMSKGIGAQAFTHGNDIYFNSGKYNTNSTAGNHLLAHELTHVVQQSGQVRSKNVQKKGYAPYYYEPIGEKNPGDTTHKMVLGEIGNNVITEAPIPNASKGKGRESPSVVGDARYGYVDIYRSTPTPAIIGATFCGDHKPWELPPFPDGAHQTAMKGGSYEIGPQVEPKQSKVRGDYCKTDSSHAKLTNVDKAPGHIELADLKPINSLEAIKGEQQVEGYAEGIKLAKNHTNDMSPVKWTTTPVVMSYSALESIVPPQFKSNSASGPIKDVRLTGPNVQSLLTQRFSKFRFKSHETFKARLVVVPDKINAGILAYAWVPTQKIERHNIPGPLQDLDKEIVDHIINPLEQPEAKKKDDPKTTVRKKADPAVITPAPISISTSPEDTIQKEEEKEFNLDKWKTHKKEVEGKAKAIKESKEYKQATESAGHIQADQLIRDHLGIQTPQSAATDLEQANITATKHIVFWGSKLSRVFGPLKRVLGDVYGAIVKAYGKFKAWMHALADKLPKPKGSGLAAAVLKAVFNVAIIIAKAVIHNVVELFKQDIVTAFAERISALVDAELEEAKKIIDAALEPFNHVIKSFEGWIDKLKNEFQPFFDLVAKIQAVGDTVTKIVNIIKWAARLLECGLPPLIGCLWALVQEASEDIIAFVVETCWFQEKIAPLLLELPTIKSISQKLYDLIKGFLRDKLPPSIADFFFPQKPSTPDAPKEDDLQCGGGSLKGGGGPGGFKPTPEQEAIIKLREDIKDEEKYKALLELLDKAAVDKNTKMSVEHINQLADAVKGLSAQDLKKMADAYQKGDTKAIPQNMAKAIQQLAHDPKGQSAPQKLDAAQQEQERKAAEARQEAQEAAVETGTKPLTDSQVQGSTHLAETILHILQGVTDEKQRLVTMHGGKYAVNSKRYKDISDGKVFPLDSLKIKFKFINPVADIKEVQKDHKTIQLVYIYIEVEVVESQNPLIPIGTRDHTFVHGLFDPSKQKGFVLNRPGVLEGIVDDIISKQPNITDKEYDFGDFKAILNRFERQNKTISLYFQATTVAKPGAVVLDQNTKQYITITPGKSFMIKEEADSDTDNATPVMKKDIHAAEGPSIQRDDDPGILSQVGSFIGDTASSVENRVSDTASAVSGAVSSVATTVTGAVSSAASTVSGAVSSAATTVSGAVSSTASSLSSAASSALSWIETAAGKAALALASRIIGYYGGTLTVSGTSIIITIPDVPLFDSFQKEIGEELPAQPILDIPLGGFADPPFAGEAAFEVNLNESLLAALGPGEIRNIRLTFDPLKSVYEGQGQLYVAAALGSRLELFGGLVGRLGALIPSEPPIPIEGSLEGGLRGTGTGWGIGAVSSNIDLAYRGGTWSFDANTDLMLGVLLTGDLDLYGAAKLYEILVCEYAYPLEHWETGNAYKINIPLNLTGGAPPIIGPITHGPMPISDIETAIEPLSYGLNCKTLQEVVAKLCDKHYLPEEVCEWLQDIMLDANEPIDNQSIAANCVARDNPGEIADTFISRCCKGSIRQEFPSDLLKETLGNIQKGKTAKHKKAWKLLNDSRFKKPGATVLTASSNRVRIQLQHKNDDVVPSETIVRSRAVTVAEGQAGVDTVMGRATKSVNKVCTGAAGKMKKTIAGYPPTGVSAKGNVARKWCDEHPDFERGIRMDLENLAGTNFTS